MSQVHSHHPVYAVKYLQYQIPRVLPAEAVCEAWVQIENGGSTVWRQNSENVRRVDLLAYVDGVLAGTFSLPWEEVHKEERVKVPFSFRAPSKPGVHTLKLDLVQQNVTLFEDQGGRADDGRIRSNRIGKRPYRQKNGKCPPHFGLTALWRSLCRS